MKRTTINADEGLLLKMKYQARREGRTVTALVQDALSEYLAAHRPKRKLLEDLTAADLNRSLEIMNQYADSNIGLVDASIVAIAERLRITRILTLDFRHFRMFRPRHCPSFELVP